jgi:hypothetical protein
LFVVTTFLRFYLLLQTTILFATTALLHLQLLFQTGILIVQEGDFFLATLDTVFKSSDFSPGAFLKG